MKPAPSLLFTYIGFVAGSLQVLAFHEKWEGLGIVVLVTMMLLIACTVHARGERKPKAMPRLSSAKKRRAAKSKLKVVGGK